MVRIKKIPLGIVVISVIMFFVALATDIFWLAKFIGGAFPSTMPLDPEVYNAFAVPDLLLSLILFIVSTPLILGMRISAIIRSKSDSSVLSIAS